MLRPMGGQELQGEHGPTPSAVREATVRVTHASESPSSIATPQILNCRQ